MDENFEETPSMWVMLGLLLAIFILMAVVVMIAFTAMNLSMATHRVGARGASGQSGISGLSGFPGGTSAPGAKGAAGASGASGSISGPSGPSGIPGKQGPSGVPSNTSGPSGVSGFSGPQGSRGASGFLNFPSMVRAFSSRPPGSFDIRNVPQQYVNPWIFPQVEEGTGRTLVWVGDFLKFDQFDSYNVNIAIVGGLPSPLITFDSTFDSTVPGTYLLEINAHDMENTSISVTLTPDPSFVSIEVTTGAICYPLSTISFNPTFSPPLQPAGAQILNGFTSQQLINTLTRNTALFDNAQSNQGYNINSTFTYQTLVVIPPEPTFWTLIVFYQTQTVGEPGESLYSSPGVVNPNFFPSNTGAPQVTMTLTRVSSNTSTVPFQ